MHKLRLLVALCCLSLLSLVASTSFATTYQATALTLGGNFSFVNGMNNHNQIVGMAETAGGEMHNFMYDNGTMVDLGYNGYTLTGINDAGQCAASDASGNVFLYDHGTLTNLNFPNFNGNVMTTRINNNGQILASSWLADGTHSYIYDSGAWTDLGSLGGPNTNIGYGLNDLGQVVGTSTTAGGQDHGFLYDNGAMTDLGEIDPAAINDLGDIAGSTNGHAFAYINGTLNNIDDAAWFYSTAYGNNNQGQVVGTAFSANSDMAFLYENGSLTDLGSLGGGAWAYDINENGLIFGMSTDLEGKMYGVVWTANGGNAIPEPGTMLLLGLGLGTLGWCRRTNTKH